MNKIKEVVNLVHVMHERHPANYSTMDDAVLVYCSVQVIASEIVILYKMKIMQNCAWLKKWKLEDVRRYIFAAAKPRGVFKRKSLLKLTISATQILASAHSAEHAHVGLNRIPKTTFFHMLEILTSLRTASSWMYLEQTSPQMSLVYRNIVLIAKWTSLFPVNDKINLMRIQLVYRMLFM